MEKKELPKISIVTVAYNCEAVLAQTMESVAAQDYPNIEYLVIDGGSKDNTLKIVEQYGEQVDFLLSEPDKNNYDAMNKGMKHATGDYVWFLHAGDLALEPTTLSQAFAAGQNEDFVYGRVKVLDEAGTEIPWHKQHPSPEELSWKSFRNGMVICHQAMFPHKDIWTDYRFEDYGLVADLDWSIRTLQQAKSFRDTETVLCSFLKGGLSAKNRRASLIERFHILRQHFGLFPTLWEHVQIFGQAIKRGKISH